MAGKRRGKDSSTLAPGEASAQPTSSGRVGWSRSFARSLVTTNLPSANAPAVTVAERQGTSSAVTRPSEDPLLAFTSAPSRPPAPPTITNVEMHQIKTSVYDTYIQYSNKRGYITAQYHDRF